MGVGLCDADAAALRGYEEVVEPAAVEMLEAHRQPNHPLPRIGLRTLTATPALVRVARSKPPICPMTLYATLQTARSEEDVKDAYIHALGLKGYTKGLIDIQTKEVWFEAKDSPKHSAYAMFTQLLHYVQVALDKGEHVPPLLAVIDTEKAALMKSSDVLPFLEKKTVKWGKSASKYTEEALAAISSHIGTHFVSYKIATHEAEFISTVKTAIKTGELLRTQITPNNLKQVFDKWVAMIGREIMGVPEEDYALLFFADIMHDGTVSTHQNLPAELLHKDGAPVFSLNGKTYELGNKEGYRQFWAIYHKPPKAEYRNYLLERRDSLIPIDERSFKGAYYTPLRVVDRAYEMLETVLGENWQSEYFVWDMCCGVGNLEVKHSNPRKLFMSTLDAPDVDVMKATKTCVGAHRFQYDYLNDDVAEDGSIDYSLTEKLPADLRNAIAGRRKILVLINPPYAEAANSTNTGGNGPIMAEHKSGVASTAIGRSMGSYGYAARELFIQFLVRISRELPTATVAMFSTLKYVNAPNFERFRGQWNARYLGGFIVHSKAFDGLNGDFPIGFLVWATQQNAKARTPIGHITTAIYDKMANPIGERTFTNTDGVALLNDWIVRPRANDTDALPLKNAITPTTSTKDVRGTKWADGAIGSMICKGSDLQNAPQQTALLSSGYCSAGSLFVTETNLWQVACVFAARRLVKHTWINHNDQFLQPDQPIPDEFVSDALIYMLFNGKNLTAGANNLSWNGRKWSLVNHFIPFTETEVDAPERFESDFMVRYLRQYTLSSEAEAVLRAGRFLWREYFSTTDVRTVRDDLLLNRSDVGWYQIRKALASREDVKGQVEKQMGKLAEAYAELSSKLQPQVAALGFLR